MTTAAPPLIDEQHAAFLQGGVSMSIGACGPGMTPTLVRGAGCRVADDRRRATVFVSASQAAPLLERIRANGLIAAVFNQPSTHRTIQIKGRDARVAALAEDDHALLARYRAAFARELEPLGFGTTEVETMLATPDIVAISFTPSEAYVQTPGPKAGERLGKLP